MLNSSKHPNEMQAYGVSREGKLIYAGTFNASRISKKAATKEHRKWLAWHKQYHGEAGKEKRQSVYWVGIHRTDSTAPAEYFQV